MPFYDSQRHTFVARRGDCEGAFVIRGHDVHVEVLRGGEVVFTRETRISEPKKAALREGFFFAVSVLAYAAQLDRDALHALAEAASGYYFPNDECWEFASAHAVDRYAYASGFAYGVEVALALAGRITDGEGE